MGVVVRVGWHVFIVGECSDLSGFAGGFFICKSVRNLETWRVLVF